MTQPLPETQHAFVAGTWKCTNLPHIPAPKWNTYADGVADPYTAAAEVAELWIMWGFDVEIAVTEDACEVTGSCDDTFLIFGAGYGGTDLRVLPSSRGRDLQPADIS